MDPELLNKDLDSSFSQNIPNRTSFLIEDILYQRQKINQDVLSTQTKQVESRVDFGPSKHTSIKFDDEKLYQHPQPKYPDKRQQDKGGYSYFQPHLHNSINGCIQNMHPPENGYIQVMGALGAYLGAPYKGISDHPYFLTQGKNYYGSRFSQIYCKVLL